jgi:hypothetical protein
MPDDPEATPPENDAPVEEKVNRLEAGLDSLRGMVESIADKITGKPAEEPVEEVAETVAEEPTTAKGQEADMEAQVRAEIQRIKAADDHAADHEKLKKEAERAPIQLGKVTQFLWGGGDD